MDPKLKQRLINLKSMCNEYTISIHGTDDDRYVFIRKWVTSERRFQEIMHVDLDERVQTYINLWYSEDPNCFVPW